MKISHKIFYVLTIISFVITIYFGIFNYNIDIMILFLGITTLLGGINQINMAQQTDSKGNVKGDKTLGYISIIAGIFIIILSYLFLIFTKR